VNLIITLWVIHISCDCKVLTVTDRQF